MVTQIGHDAVHSLLQIEVSHVQINLWILGALIGAIDAREVLEFASPRLLVQAL